MRTRLRQRKKTLFRIKPSLTLRSHSRKPIFGRRMNPTGTKLSQREKTPLRTKPCRNLCPHGTKAVSGQRMLLLKKTRKCPLHKSFVQRAALTQAQSPTVRSLRAAKFPTLRKWGAETRCPRTSSIRKWLTLWLTVIRARSTLCTLARART